MTSSADEQAHPRVKVPIAVVGVSALFPGSVDETGFWRDILAGRDLVRDVPPSHWLIEDYYDPDPKAPDKTYAKRGAFLEEVAFDPMAFGVPPSIAPATDSSQLLGLIVAQRVLEDAARNAGVDRDRTSVILGVTSGQELLASMVSRLQRPVWQKSLREAGIPESKVETICQRIADHYVPWQESSFPGLLGNVVAGRIANRMDLGGTNCVTDAACASAFSAVSMAVSELYLGDSDMVITGGVDTLNDIFMYMCFSKTPALSATGDCRPFSDKADGTILGEGLGMVALKRLEDAERDGDAIYAVIRGVGSSSDGRAKSVYAPRPSGQAKALARAYDHAGYGPDTVELLEAHGTATKAGDKAEFAGLRLAFEEAEKARGEGESPRRRWCALGSVKSQIGHTKAAAGSAGLFKAVMALQHKVLPPTIKVEKPNPELEVDESPFYLNTEARPWVRAADHPRRAGVSSFGFGGSNFHIAVEEYHGKAPHAGRLRTSGDELVVVTADSPEALAEALRGLEIPEPANWRPALLPFLARQSQEAYDASAPARAAIVAKDDEDLRNKLHKAADLVTKHPGEPQRTPTGIHLGYGAPEGDVAFLFPGQGSQYLGMGKGLAMAQGEAIGPWDRAADLARGEHALFDAPLHEVVFPPPAFDDETRAAQRERLVQTEWAQPAIGCTSLSMFRLTEALGLVPAMVGGHSFGEVIALHAAGAYDEATALTIARRRGQLMAEAAATTAGSMCAVSAPIDRVRQVVEEAGLDVVVANHNAPDQVVLSGATEAIAKAETVLADAGLTAKRLPVATAFHSAIVRDSSEPFAAALADLPVSAPTLPVFANTTAAPYASNVAAVRDTLAAQIAEPVRFVEQIEAMHDAGARIFLEVGPGSVLTGLTRRILEGRPHRAVALDKRGCASLRSWHAGLAELVAAGLPLDLSVLWREYRELTDPRQMPAPKMTLGISGTNYGKPYPPPEGAAALPPPNPELAPTDAPVAAAPAPSGANGAAASPIDTHSPFASETTYAEANVNDSSHSNTPHQGAAPSPATTTPETQAPMMAYADPWLVAYQQAQQQTAAAHTAFQNAMAQAHIAFLQTSEGAMDGLVAMATGVAPSVDRERNAYVPQAVAAPPAATMVAAPMPQQPTVYHAAPPASQAAPPAPAPQPAPQAAPPAPQAAPPAPQAAPPAPKAAPPAPAPQQAAPAPVAEPAAPSGVDPEALLLEVVADKTGYPSDMLSMDMALEADLGIDSIKRVEILSEMMKRAPGLPKVDTKKMASLNTLGEIVQTMNDHLGGGETPAAGATRPKASSAATP